MKRRNGRRAGIRLTILLTVAVVAWQYAREVMNDSFVNAYVIVHGLGERPFVYRTLMPWLAQFLVMLGLREDVALITVVIASAIGLIYATQYFLSSFRRR